MLFELLPYPMDIVIAFLKPSKFYITSNNQRPVTSTSGKVGGARLRRFMVMSTIEVQKKITRPVPLYQLPPFSLLCSMATGERRLVTDDRGNKTPGGTRGGLAPDRGHHIGR